MLRPELALLLIIFIFATGCLCEDATVIVKLPDDDNFRKFSIAYISIKALSIIDSVRVSAGEQPKVIDVDKSGDPHRIMFKPDMPTGVGHLTVTVDSNVFTLHLMVERLPIGEIENSVFLVGPSANVTRLLAPYALKNNSDIRIISLKPVSNSITEAVVQVYKAGTADILPLWEAYEWMIKQVGPSSGVQLMPDRCPADRASSGQLCRCRLTFTSGHPSVHSVDVQLGSADILENFMGFGLSWVPQTVDQMHMEACGPGTCLNGGTCDPSFLGIGFRCKCPSKQNTPWGPRCEHPTISYYTHDSRLVEPLAFTRHWIGDLPHSTSSLELSFEFSASHGRSSNDEMFELKSWRNLNKPLLSVSVATKENSLSISGNFLGSKIVKHLVNGLHADGWFVVHILMKEIWMHVVICPKNLMGVTTTPLGCERFKEMSSAGNTLNTDFRNFWLEIGKNFEGCVQSVAVNGYSVDLAAARVVGVDTSRVRDRCIQQNGACTHFSNPHNYACGNNSVCYGVLRYRVIPTRTNLDCNCKCLGSMRSQSETVTGSGVCKTRQSCNKEPLILSTISANFSRWVLNGHRPLPLTERTAMSIELELRTRIGTVSGILTGLVRGASGSQVLLLSCWQYPPIRINDGEWHSVSATIKHELLMLTMDGVSSMHDRGSITTGFKSMELLSSIENSNLQNIRVSGIYMSMNNDTDRSMDPGGDFVVPFFPEDVIVYKVGINPAPSCECKRCPAGRCVRLWGKTSCECEIGQERDSRGICADINPCTKFGISCPRGSECRNASGDPGFQCICPVGARNKLCVIGEYEKLLELAQSTAVDLADMQGWIWLIAGLIGLAMLG